MSNDKKLQRKICIEFARFGLWQLIGCAFDVCGFSYEQLFHVNSLRRWWSLQIISGAFKFIVTNARCWLSMAHGNDLPHIENCRRFGLFSIWILVHICAIANIKCCKRPFGRHQVQRHTTYTHSSIIDNKIAVVAYSIYSRCDPTCPINLNVID